MLDLLPDLSGQPWWVVVIVVALVVAGSVGVKWIGVRHARDDSEPDEVDAEPDRPALPPSQREGAADSDARTALVLTKALDLLANEAVESQGARAEVERMRAELIACSAERDRVAQNLVKAQADLEQCNLECRKLALRALELGGDSGE